RRHPPVGVGTGAAGPPGAPDRVGGLARGGCASPRPERPCAPGRSSLRRVVGPHALGGWLVRGGAPSPDGRRDRGLSRAPRGVRPGAARLLLRLPARAVARALAPAAPGPLHR